MRLIAALRPSWPYVAEVARSLFGVLIAVAAALHWGSPAAAIAVGGASAITGAIALQDSRHGRLPLVLGVGAGLSMAVLIGWTTAPYGLAFVLAAIIWAAGAGMLWGVSANAGLVAAAGTVLLVTAPVTTTPVPGAPMTALWAFAAALLQVLLVAVRPAQRWQQQRIALTEAYQSMAADARRISEDPALPVDIDPLIALRESYTLSERQARRRPPAFRGLYALPERIALTLNGLRGYAAEPGVPATLVACSDVLTAIADGGYPGQTRANAGLERLAAALQKVPESAAAPAARLHAQLLEAAGLQFDRLRGPGLRTTLRGVISEVRNELHWDSPILRHAVRLATAIGLGVALGRWTGLGHGYWVALTVLIVLRPETAHTYTRCVSRVAGTAAGVTAATLLTTLLHPGGVLAAFLAVVCVAVAYGVSGIGYVPLSAALAAAIVFLLSVGGYADDSTLGGRLLATLIGGLLAVASHVVLPDQSLIRLQQRAGELLKAEIDYAAVVIRSFVHRLERPEIALSAAWQRALRARSSFEAASGSAWSDVAPVRGWLMTYRAALNAVTGACVTLENQAPGVPSSLDRRFVVAVDDYVDALRGDAPRPGQAWRIDVTHLGEADQQLRESAAFLDREHSAQRVLVGEVETITRQLIAVARQAK